MKNSGGNWVLRGQLRFTAPTLIISFLLFSLVRKALSDDPKPGDCEPKHCGNGLNISYPFWISNLQPPHCGYPNFEIACKDGAPGVVTDSEYYLVEKIFYDNKSVIISSDEFRTSPCPYPRHNLSLARTPFNVSSVNRQLFFYLNCTQRLPRGAREFKCANNGNGRASFVADLPVRSYENACDSVITWSFLASGARSDSRYDQLLRNGFLLEWEAPDCRECANSGGRCGYNRTNSQFMCICSDSVHGIMCNYGHPRGINRRRKLSFFFKSGSGLKYWHTIIFSFSV